SWRQVARPPATRIAESRGNDREAALVVERRSVDAEPLAQPVATRVVPGNARLVHARARRLPDDQHPCPGVRAQHRLWSKRQVLLAHPARPHLREDPAQLILHRAHAFELTPARLPCGLRLFHYPLPPIPYPLSPMPSL